MSHIVTGRDLSETEHELGLASFGLVVSLIAPIAPVVLGMALLGPAAVSWGGVLAAGLLGAIAFREVIELAQRRAWTLADPRALLRTQLAAVAPERAQVAGSIAHHATGVTATASWAYVLAIAGIDPGWRSALLWGGFLWLMTLLAFSTVGVAHREIRHGRQDDPGPGGVNLGPLTPLVLFAAHLAFAVTMAATYMVWVAD